MFFEIISLIIMINYFLLNFYVAFSMSSKDMKSDFIDNQILVGKIISNIFFIPAWFMKCLRFVILTTIA